MKAKLLLLIILLMVGCATLNRRPSKSMFGSYLFINSKDVFYNEIKIALNSDSSFYYLQTVHSMGYRVNGMYRHLQDEDYLLTILDTPMMQVQTVPLYDFYHVQDTMTFRTTNVIKINGRRFKRQNE